MKVKDFFNTIHLISAILACLCLAFQLVIISVNVIMRYCFSSGISWMEEISKDVLMSAFTFLSMAIGVKLDSHIHVDLFPRKTPHWISTALAKLKYSVLAIIGFVLLFYGVSLILNIKASIASLPWMPASVQFIMIPLAGLLILYDAIVNIFGLGKEADYLDRKFMDVGAKP